MVARVVSATLEPLTDGVPHSRRRVIVVAELPGRHDKQDVPRTFMRLAVIGQVVGTGGRYVPVPIEASQA